MAAAGMDMDMDMDMGTWTWTWTWVAVRGRVLGARGRRGACAAARSGEAPLAVRALTLAPASHMSATQRYEPAKAAA